MTNNNTNLKSRDMLSAWLRVEEEKMPGKYYWIKERFNPQLPDPYYVAYGNISATEAKKMEKSIYGDNHMLKFVSKEDYEKTLSSLRRKGMRVINR